MTVSFPMPTSLFKTNRYTLPRFIHSRHPISDPAPSREKLTHLRHMKRSDFYDTDRFSQFLDSEYLPILNLDLPDVLGGIEGLAPSKGAVVPWFRKKMELFTSSIHSYNFSTKSALNNVCNRPMDYTAISAQNLDNVANFPLLAFSMYILKKMLTLTDFFKLVLRERFILSFTFLRT